MSDTLTTSRRPRATQRLRRAVWYLALLAIVSAPAAFAIYDNWGEPLWATKTVVVERTVTYGIVPDVVLGIGGFYLLLFLAGAAAVYGPRRF